jgi:GNAT superfamily N-acetyltransferase
MAWQLTSDIDDFMATAGDYLHTDPVRNTVPLTVLAALRESGPAVFGDAAPLFAWHWSAEAGSDGTITDSTDSPGIDSPGIDSTGIDGAALRTPPHPLLIAGFPAGAAEALLRAFAADRPTGASAPEPEALELSAAWTAVTGGSTAVHVRMRLFRLAGLLLPPDPLTPGSARVAGQDDLELLIDWAAAFATETRTGADSARSVADKLSYGGIMIWETAGQPVAMASLTRQVAGVCRVGSVYTPPQHRKAGYGGAITTAVSQRALDDGAAEVILYTDLANPTTNALYQRLGYRPVEDRIALDLL